MYTRASRESRVKSRVPLAMGNVPVSKHGADVEELSTPYSLFSTSSAWQVGQWVHVDAVPLDDEVDVRAGRVPR